MALMPERSKLPPMPKGSKLTLMFGLDAGFGDEAMLTVWVSTKRKYPDIRSRVLANAETLDLQAMGWVVRDDDEVILDKRSHTMNHPTMTSAVEWFMTCFNQLNRADIFALQLAYAGDDPTVVDAVTDAAD